MVKEVMHSNEKAIASYVLGIQSIIFGVISPFAGLIIVGIVMTNKKTSDLEKRARKLNFIGLIVSIVMFIISVIVFLIVGTKYPSLLATP